MCVKSFVSLSPFVWSIDTYFSLSGWRIIVNLVFSSFAFCLHLVSPLTFLIVIKPHSVTCLLKAHTYISPEGRIAIRIFPTLNRLEVTAPALLPLSLLCVLAFSQPSSGMEPLGFEPRTQGSKVQPSNHVATAAVEFISLILGHMLFYPPGLLPPSPGFKQSD